MQNHVWEEIKIPANKHNKFCILLRKSIIYFSHSKGNKNFFPPWTNAFFYFHSPLHNNDGFIYFILFCFYLFAALLSVKFLFDLFIYFVRKIFYFTFHAENVAKQFRFSFVVLHKFLFKSYKKQQNYNKNFLLCSVIITH